MTIPGKTRKNGNAYNLNKIARLTKKIYFAILCNNQEIKMFWIFLIFVILLIWGYFAYIDGGKHD